MHFFAIFLLFSTGLAALGAWRPRKCRKSARRVSSRHVEGTDRGVCESIDALCDACGIKALKFQPKPLSVLWRAAPLPEREVCGRSMSSKLLKRQLNAVIKKDAASQSTGVNKPGRKTGKREKNAKKVILPVDKPEGEAKGTTTSTIYERNLAYYRATLEPSEVSRKAAEQMLKVRRDD